MNTISKFVIAGGILLLIFGSIFGFSGIAELDEQGKKVSDYISDADTEITKQYTDADGMGSSGWLIMIEGEYLDENDDNRTDACSDMTFSITDEFGNNVTEKSGQFECYMGEEWSDELLDPVEDDGWIVVAYVCDTISEGYDNGCSEGVSYTITSNKSMKLYDSDKMNQVIGEIILAKVIPAGGAGFLGCCLLIIGGIMALTMGKKSEPVVVYQQGAVAMNPNNTHMSQPVLQQQHESYETPAQTGLTPPSGGL